MPEYMEMTRNKLAELLEGAVKEGFAERIRAVLAARSQGSRLPQTKDLAKLVPQFSIALCGFEEITDEKGNTLVKTEGKVQVLFEGNEQEVYLEGLDLKFCPFTIRVEYGYYLGVNNQPTLPEIVETLASLPTKEAVIDANTATIHFYRPLTGWEGFFLCLCLDPDQPYWLVAGDLTEIRVVWD